MTKRVQSHKRTLSDGCKVVEGSHVNSQRHTLILLRHLRLARACYKTTSDADVAAENCHRYAFAGMKRARTSHYDFWTRVDLGEINIQQPLDEWRKRIAPLKGVRINTNIPNYAISTTNMADYSYKSTAFGDVYYSPRFNDNKYIYRFVILTRGVRSEACRLLKNCGRYFLTEPQIIHQLGIDLSPGWEHFMVFRNKLDELILRRPLNS